MRRVKKETAYTKKCRVFYLCFLITLQFTFKKYEQNENGILTLNEEDDYKMIITGSDTTRVQFCTYELFTD